jgi:hypothetical protein
MKFVLTWTPRGGGSPAEASAAQKAAMDRLGNF